MSDLERRAVVIEDDDDVRTLLTQLLQQAGFDVTAADNGAAGIRAVRELDADLVTLDLNLPDLDGIEVCRRIRDISEAYIVMLTGRPDEIDRLVGLETGADDYLTKPFSPRELRARVAAMMRRPRTRAAATAPPAATAETEAAEGVMRHGDLEVDVEGRIVLLEGKELDLTRTEFDLLATLLSGPRRVWPRDSLLRAVLRRHHLSLTRRLCQGDLALDRETREVWRADRPIDLTPREFDLLELLIAHPRQVFSRETLLNRIWGYDHVADPNVVEVYISSLRDKIGDKDRQLIRTVRGVGYTLRG